MSRWQRVRAWWLRISRKTAQGNKISLNDSQEVVLFQDFLREAQKTKKPQRAYRKVYGKQP